MSKWLRIADAEKIRRMKKHYQVFNPNIMSEEGNPISYGDAYKPTGSTTDSSTHSTGGQPGMKGSAMTGYDTGQYNPR